MPPDDRADRPTADGALTPAQRDVLARLGAAGGDRPTFPAGLRDELLERLTTELAPAIAALPEGEALWVRKHDLAGIHACEARWVAQDADDAFEPSIPIVRGTVVHKAIELSVTWRGEVVPLVLVDEAVARISEGEHWATEFLQRATEADLAELRAQANELVSAFLEAWPRLKAAWRPVTEARMRHELAGGRVVLVGRVDLTLGSPVGSREVGEPVRAGKVIVDFKTGGWSPAHHEDLRFYALVETLRMGVPPRKVASAYLDSATVRDEAVTEGALHAAAARVADGALRMVELRHAGRQPTKRPSVACRWCALRPECEEGRAFLAEERDEPAPYDL